MKSCVFGKVLFNISATEFSMYTFLLFWNVKNYVHLPTDVVNDVAILSQI